MSILQCYTLVMDRCVRLIVVSLCPIISFIPFVLPQFLAQAAEGAENQATAGITFYVPCSDTFYYSGLVSEHVQEPQKEIQRYTAILDANQRDTKAYFNRGYVKLQLGDRAAAAEDWHHALEMIPNTADEYATACLLKL
jgi:tetratricopeptide (TPR) repeat protein